VTTGCTRNRQTTVYTTNETTLFGNHLIAHNDVTRLGIFYKCITHMIIYKLETDKLKTM
jgi:hypothetical protein